MLKARVITALFLVAGFIGVLFFLPDWISVFVFSIVAALAAWEWGGLMQVVARYRVAYAWITLALTEYLIISDSLSACVPVFCVLAMLFWLLVVPLWFRQRWKLPVNISGYIIGWVVILPTWLALVVLYRKNPWLLLAAMALVWVADIAAYFTGRAFGKKKLAPSISPGKTREGAVGALLAVLLYGGLIAQQYWPQKSLSAWLGLALVLLLLTALSIIGDLFESLLKRQANIKDSSNLLPGHGGVLDRIDSLTSTLPLVALYFYWVAV